MLETVIVGMSMALQFIAVGLAIRLIHLSRHWVAWTVVAAAMGLMGLRRLITFYRTVSEDAALPPDLAAESVAFAISALLVSGMLLIGPVLVRMRRAQQALKQSEERFRSFAESSSDWFWEMDPDLKINYVSDRIADITGYPAIYNIGKTRQDLSGEDVETEKWRDHLQALARREPFKDFYYIRTGPDGEAQHILTSGVPVFDPAGAFLGYRGTATNITERQRLRDSLVASEDLLNSIFENVPVGLLIKGADHIVERPNRTYLDWYDLKADDVLGLRSDETIDIQPRDDAARMRTHEEAVVATGETRTRQVERRFADGELHTVHITKFPVYDRVGNITKVGTVFVDVSEQVAAQRALQSSDLLLRSIIDNLPVGLLAKDIHGRHMMVNETFCQWHDVTPQQILATDTGDVLAEKYEDLDVVADQETHVAATGESVSRHTERVLADGELHHILINKYPIFDGEGAVSGVVSISIDITEQVAAQREIGRQSAFLDSIVENIPNMVFVKEAEELRFTLLNKAGEDLLGVSREDYMGKSDFDFFPNEQAEFFIEKDREVLAQGGLLDIPEEPLDSKIMGRRLLHTKKIAIRDEDGNPQYLLGISEDITDQKRIERELAESLTAANRANRAKSEFLAHMSHELRTPLNSVIGFTQVIIDGIFGKPSKKHKEYLVHIRASAEHLLDVINDILDISRLEAGEITIDETVFPVAAPIYDATALVGILAEEKHQTIQIELPEDDLHLQADERLVRQILVNLVSNATKFTPDAGVITVRAEIDDAKGIVFRVTDTGHGIPADDIPKIMEPFGQARHTANTSHEGTGLGLSISTRMAELHGARLTIDSKVGQGTVVHVAFPPERTAEPG